MKQLSDQEVSCVQYAIYLTNKFCILFKLNSAWFMYTILLCLEFLDKPATLRDSCSNPNDFTNVGK